MSTSEICGLFASSKYSREKRRRLHSPTPLCLCDDALLYPFESPNQPPRSNGNSCKYVCQSMEPQAKAISVISTPHCTGLIRHWNLRLLPNARVSLAKVSSDSRVLTMYYASLTLFRMAADLLASLPRITAWILTALISSRVGAATSCILVAPRATA